MAGLGVLAATARSALTGGLLAVRGVEAVRAKALDFGPWRDELAAFDDDRSRQLEELAAGASLAELNDVLDSGRMSCAELTLCYLGRIRRLDGELGSILELNPNALVEARAADRRRAEGGRLGLLDGIPVTVKDNIETAAPMHTTGGAAVLADHIAAADAPVVQALRAAGAVVLGKANLSELAGAVSRIPGVSALGGRTSNPYGRRFTPGGSSSGSAVAVAAGLCAASVGTETSGSLLAPAAFNGVVGMKPSRGSVASEGIIPLVRHQDSAGPLARDVAGAAILLAAMTGRPAPPLSKDALSGAVAGVLRADVLAQRRGVEDPADNPALLDRISTGLVAAGATIVDAETPSALMAGYEEGFLAVVLGGLASDTMSYLESVGAPVSSLADVAAFNLRQPRLRMPKGQLLLSLARFHDSGAQAHDLLAMEYRQRATAILEAAFSDADADVLVSLANLHSSLYATAGYPAITVPLGLRANGMPTGVTLIGRPGQDATLLAFAHAFEQATLLRVAPKTTD